MISSPLPHPVDTPTHITMESPAFEDIEKGADALRTVKDLAAGAAGGIAQVLLGMCVTRAHRIPETSSTPLLPID